jgi:flagellar motor switch protein FliN/FliY
MSDTNLPLQDFGPSTAVTPYLSDNDGKIAADLAPVFDVPVSISAVLGKAHISVADLLRLGQGSVLELDRRVGEPIDIYVNNRLVARGEMVVQDERLGVTMTEIIKDGDAV